jgi:phage repressor protein C with HTH and peptisase S24 domain
MCAAMATVDDDIQMVRDLIAWTGTNAAKVAAAIGKPNTTINRFSNGSAKHRMHRDTFNALREKFPEFPGFKELPLTNAKIVKFEGASSERMRDDLPIYGTALGAARKIDGEAIEQVTLNTADVIEYVKRPTLLNEKPGAYGLVVSGSSMEPRHNDGETIVVDPNGRVKNGEDVVVYLRPAGDADDGDTARAVLVKRLVRRTSSYFELEQYTPAMTFQIDAADVLRVDRVIPWSELLS